jgi:hypothetical protein
MRYENDQERPVDSTGYLVGASGARRSSSSARTAGREDDTADRNGTNGASVRSSRPLPGVSPGHLPSHRICNRRSHTFDHGPSDIPTKIVGE